MGGVRYARSDDVSIAYLRWGEGPAEIVVCPGFASHVGALERPENVAFDPWLEPLKQVAHVTNFDKRGTGMSERAVGMPDLQTRMDDIRAVMDAAGIEAAHLIGISEGGPMAILFAATYPDRAQSLALLGTFARFTKCDDHPWLPTEAERLEVAKLIEKFWGTGRVVTTFMPAEQRTPEVIAEYAGHEMESASPKAMRTLMEMNLEIDVRAILPTIQVPTLVAHDPVDEQVPIESGRYLAEHIPGARFVELHQGAHYSLDPRRPDWVDPYLEMITGHAPVAAPADRVLATVLFTDIVGSTELAAQQGDASWRATLDRHDAAVRREVDAHRGVLVKSTGDGVLAHFDGPGRAVACARAIDHDVASFGLRTRAGAHTGEVELRGDDIGGIAVHIASRVAGLAGAGEVLVSRTVKDLTAGSGLAWEDRGEHDLKGVPDSWQLFAAVA